jgi:DNA-binding SARP family transcriptional activator
MWCGEPLANLVPAPFVTTARLSLEDLRLAARKQRASALIRIGATTRAFTDLQELLAAHPNDETVLLLLTTTLCHMGAAGKALTLLNSELERWEHELGLLPPTLAQQRTRIIRNEIIGDRPWSPEPGAIR